jgi:hypothetical protein
VDKAFLIAASSKLIMELVKDMSMENPIWLCKDEAL